MFKRLERRGFRRLKKLAGGGGRGQGAPTQPGGRAAGDLADDALQDLARRWGLRLAKKIAALQGQYPQGTEPELVFYEWLQRTRHEFIYQAGLYGGRTQRGGLVPDFVIRDDPARAVVVQIQGDYWHSIRLRGDADRRARERMLGQVIQGARVAHVVELWEHDIRKPQAQREQIFLQAAQGVEL